MEEPSVTHQMAAQRETAARAEYTAASAIADAEYYRSHPECIVSPDQAKRTIDALLAALQASPCYLKASKLGLPTFVLLPYDRAGHIAMQVWAKAAEDNGCRPAKTSDAWRLSREWALRPDCKWPD